MPTLTITESASGPRTIQPPALAIIGLVATATAAAGAATTALDAAFPVGELTLVSNIDAAITAAGTGGTLRPALEAIRDQVTPIIVVARVAPGAGEGAEEETDENVIAGLNQLLTARTAVGVAPRIIGAPGLDTQVVTTEMVIIAQRLRAMAYAAAIGDDIAEASTYRDNFSARELMLIWPNTSPDFAGDAVARALGLRSQIDEQRGWHESIMNVAINGVTSVTQSIAFDLLDPSTDAGVLNDAQITTIIRDTGFRFWGARTTAGEEQSEFSFETAVRTSHALQDIIAQTFRPFMGRPMTVGRIKDLLETVNAAFRNLAVRGRIMGAKAFFDADTNSSEQLAAGMPDFRIQYTSVAPMENPTVRLIITDFYYSGFADQIA